MNRERAARLAGVGAVVGLAVAAAWVHAAHAMRAGETTGTLVFGALIPLLLSGALLVVGGSMLRDRTEGRYALRVAAWTVGGAAALSAMAALTILHQRAEGAAVSHPGLVVANLATGGAVAGALVGLYDVERKRTEARLTAEREKADRLGQQLAVTNRVLRHDIRNGMTVIGGFAQLIRQDGSDAEENARRIERKASELHEVSENARRIERMVRDGDATERVDVAGIVGRAADRLADQFPAATVRTDLPASAPVEAHPLLDSAIENVLDNAARHNDGEPTVEAGVRTLEDGRVEVRIADDGPGIPPEEIAVLEGGEETQLRHASGLGLWLVNWIVTESGGEVAFAENDPRGSVVLLRLPAAGEA